MIKLDEEKKKADQEQVVKEKKKLARSGASYSGIRCSHSRTC